MTPGLHTLTAEQYHADPCPTASLSSSIAKILTTQSPLHAWYQHPRLNPDFQAEHDSRFDIGSAAHMLLLEKRSDAIVIVNADDWRTKAAKEARDAARANGQIPVLARYFDVMSKMAVRARAFLDTTELVGMLDTGNAEQTILWQEGSSWCRCRPDLISADRRVFLDYKSTENAEPEAFIRQIGRMSYDLQAEFYLRGGKAAIGHEPVFIFLAQEISEPFSCSLIGLANSYRAVGQAKVERALAIWKSCTESNNWPSYSAQIAYAEPRPWELTEMEAAEGPYHEGSHDAGV
jgi:hypothetical protein